MIDCTDCHHCALTKCCLQICHDFFGQSARDRSSRNRRPNPDMCCQLMKCFWSATLSSAASPCTSCTRNRSRSWTTCSTHSGSVLAFPRPSRGNGCALRRDHRSLADWGSSFLHVVSATLGIFLLTPLSGPSPAGWPFQGRHKTEGRGSCASIRTVQRK